MAVSDVYKPDKRQEGVEDTSPIDDYLEKMEQHFLEQVLNIVKEAMSPTEKCKNTSNCHTCSGSDEANCINELIINRLRLYIDSYHRIPYNVVTNEIYKLSSDDRAYDRFINRMHGLVNYIRNKIDGESNEDVKDKLLLDLKICMKLYDHIQLATKQTSLIYEREDLIKSVNEAFKENVNSQLNSYNAKVGELKKVVNKTVNKAEKKYKNITQQLISIVSIFTAVSFVIFGGLTSISALFEAASSGISLVNTIALGCVFGLVLINATYIFLRFILIILDKANNSTKMMKTILYTNSLLTFIMFCSVLLSLYPNLIIDLRSFNINYTLVTMLLIIIVILALIINHLINKTCKGK